MMGAEILLLSSSDEKLEQGRALGAHHLINYRKTPEWGEAAREIFDGRGADVVVDVGGAETFQQAVDALTSGGHISQVGLLSGTSATMPIVTFMTKGAHVHGISVGSRIAFEEMNRAIALHEWRPVINRTFAFDQAREAIDHFARGCLGKTVIEID